MLENMFLGNPRGNYDRLLDFSTAVTGSTFGGFTNAEPVREDGAEQRRARPGTTVDVAPQHGDEIGYANGGGGFSHAQPIDFSICPPARTHRQCSRRDVRRALMLR